MMYISNIPPCLSHTYSFCLGTTAVYTYCREQMATTKPSTKELTCTGADQTHLFAAHF